MPRKELYEAADALDAGQAAPVAIGEPTISDGVERAIIRFAKTVKHDMKIAADELTKEMTDALKQTETAGRS